MNDAALDCRPISYLTMSRYKQMQMIFARLARQARAIIRPLRIRHRGEVAHCSPR